MAEKVKAAARREVIFGIRPENIYPAPLAAARADNGTSQVAASVDLVEPLGPSLLTYLKIGDLDFQALFEANTRVQPGETLKVAFDLKKAHFFDPDTETALLGKPV